MYTEFVVGKDGENNKRLQNAEIKHQKTIDNMLLDSKVKNKIDNISNKPILNSSNELLEY